MIDKGFVKIDRDIKIDYSSNDIRCVCQVGSA